MAQGMHRCNVTISLNGHTLTHWTGTVSEEGGELQAINMSATKGPPVFAYCDDNRSQIKVNITTKILGDTESEQEAFIAQFARGTVITSHDISGITPGLNWIIENATVTHNADGEEPSTLAIVLAETGPADGSGSS